MDPDDETSGVNGVYVINIVCQFSTCQLMKNLKELEEIYGDEKNESEVWGGRGETAAEKGLI